MNKTERNSIKSKIIALIGESKQAIADMEEMTAPVSPENAIGRLSRMDAINNKSVMEMALRKKKEKLSRLQMALTNIDKPEFGICARCKNQIQTKRLIYMPESVYCIRCADRM